MRLDDHLRKIDLKLMFSAKTNKAIAKNLKSLIYHWLAG